MDLRQLRYFVAVATERHITRAAERLGMQQPPLSAQIKALEASLGVQLFHRRPRGVELTEAGQEFFNEAQEILARIERAVRQTKRTARGEMGRLSVAIAPTAPFHKVVPRAIRDFRRAFPLVNLTLEEGLSNEVTQGLVDQRIDVAFVRNAHIDVDGLLTIRLLDEPMVLALASRHVVAKSTPAHRAVDLSELCNEGFIMIGPAGTGLHDEAISACQSAGYRPRIVQQAPRITSALGLVAAELGVVLVPECLKTLKMDGVVYRAVTAPKPPKSFLGLTISKSNRSAVLKNFVAGVRAGAQSHALRVT